MNVECAIATGDIICKQSAVELNLFTFIFFVIIIIKFLIVTLEFIRTVVTLLNAIYNKIKYKLVNILFPKGIVTMYQVSS